MFFNFRKHKTNMHLKQKLSKMDLKIIRFKNQFLKKTFLFSIYNNFLIILESFIFFGFTPNIKSNFLYLNSKNEIKNLTSFAIVLDNSIYLKKQLLKLKNISFLYNIFRFFIFIIQNIILKLFLILHSISK